MSRNGQIALALGLVAVLAIVVAVSMPGDSEQRTDLACALSGPAASAVVVAVTQGRSAGQIAGSAVAGAFVPFACKGMIESIIETPEESVSFDLELPDGGTASQTATGSELLVPAPPPVTTNIPPGATITRLLECRGWTSRVLWEQCVAGTLPPLRSAAVG